MQFPSERAVVRPAQGAAVGMKRRASRLATGRTVAAAAFWMGAAALFPAWAQSGIGEGWVTTPLQFGVGPDTECPKGMHKRFAWSYPMITTCTAVACTPRLVCPVEGDCSWVPVACNTCTPIRSWSAICLTNDELVRAMGVEPGRPLEGTK